MSAAPPPLIPGTVPPRGKTGAKTNAGTGPNATPNPSKWEWKSFTNPARTDGLELRHWQKQGPAPDEYPFSRFNKTAQVLKYNDDEYVRALAQADWSKQDTDQVMKLAQRFELNFILVADRWQGPARPTEALKDRFYTVQRKLAEVRGLAPGGAEENQDSVLIAQPFNKEWEEQRKAGLDKIYSRSKKEEKTDAEVLEQAKKIEAIQRKRKLEQKKKKGPDAHEEEGQAVPSGGIVLRSNILARTQDQIQAHKWLESIEMRLGLCTQHTQPPFQTLINDVVTLLDWQKKVLRKKKERDAQLEKKNELLRPLKKRKTAPSQRLVDGQGTGGTQMMSAPSTRPAVPGTPLTPGAGGQRTPTGAVVPDFPAAGGRRR